MVALADLHLAFLVLRVLQILAVVAVADLKPVVEMADLALSLFDTHFNWRSTWHILQK